MIIPIDGEKALGKIQHPSKIKKNTQLPRSTKEIPYLHKGQWQKMSTADIIINDEKLHAFFLRLGIGQGCLSWYSCSTLLLKVLEIKQTISVQR